MYTDLARFSVPATGCSVQFGCENRLKLPFLHVFCPIINGPKDAKTWPMRVFASHPKDTHAAHKHAFPPRHCCCQNFDRVFELPPNGSVTHTMRQRTFHKQHATHNLEYMICTTQHTICNTPYGTHNMPHTTCNTYGKHNMQHATCSTENNIQRCVAIAPTVIGVSRRHHVPEVVELGTVRILTMHLPFTGYTSWKGDQPHEITPT